MVNVEAICWLVILARFRLTDWLQIIRLWLLCCIKPAPEFRTKRKLEEPKLQELKLIYRKNAKKPQWVSDEIIRLKAQMSQLGYTKIADAFNQLHAINKNMTVGRTFVGEVIKNNQHQIAMLRKKIKLKPASYYDNNQLWSIDLTNLTDTAKKKNSIFGVIDAGTRANLLLEKVEDKSSFTLLVHLLILMNRYGKPKAIRSDNEAVFKSWWFRLNLKLLGIKQQFTELASPWQNGRIERFFGTFKQAIKKIKVAPHELELRLIEFRFYYNHVRTHQALKGKTPSQAWSRKAPNFRNEPVQISLWQGLLSGYYWES